jgi:segregation and condensation protein B
MNESYIKNVVEAAMLAAGRPLQVAELAQLFDENSRPDVPTIRAALTSLEADYAGRGIEVKETATGFRIQVRRDMANEVSRLWPERPPKYTRALLETLALIAYRQPITRAEIEAVRGVAVNPNIVKTLLERNWVRVLGTRDVPGRPELLGTTKDFLDYFGLRSLEDLPPLADLKAMGDVNLQLDLSKDETPAAASTDAGSGSDAAAASAGAGSEDSRDAVNGEHVAGESNGAPDGAGVATASDEVEGAAVARASEVTAAADTDSNVSDEARAEALLEAAEGAEVASAADADRADLDVAEGESAAAAESVADASEESPREEREAGPQKRAAEAFVAEFDGDDADADASGSDDDSADEDELSADSQGSSELVAGPRHLDD